MIESLKKLSMKNQITQLQVFGVLEEGHKQEAIFDNLIFAFFSRVPVNDMRLY